MGRRMQKVGERNDVAVSKTSENSAGQRNEGDKDTIEIREINYFHALRRLMCKYLSYIAKYKGGIISWRHL
jgi:hypothetical protein